MNKQNSSKSVNTLVEMIGEVLGNTSLGAYLATSSDAIDSSADGSVPNDSIKFPSLIWRISGYDDLGSQEVVEINTFKKAIFLAEKKYVSTMMDRKDIQAIHIRGYLDNQLVAYMRITSLGSSASGGFSFEHMAIRADLDRDSIELEIVRLGMEHINQFKPHDQTIVNAFRYSKVPPHSIPPSNG